MRTFFRKYWDTLKEALVLMWGLSVLALLFWLCSIVIEGSRLGY